MPKKMREKLTQRQRIFCERYIGGMTQKTAYISAGFSPKFIGGPAALLKRPEVKQHIEFLREVQRVRLNVTVQSLVLDLRRGQDLAVECANAPAFVAATMGLARLMGFLKDDRPDADIAIYLNRPLREPTRELELTPDEWIKRWAPKQLEDGVKANGHGNGHDGGKDQD